MGCGCKKNKNNRLSTDSKTSKLFKEQKDYRARVNEAIKQFADLKKLKHKGVNR